MQSLWSSIYVAMISFAAFLQPLNPGTAGDAPATTPPATYPWEGRWLLWVIGIGILLAIVYGLTSFSRSDRPRDVPPPRQV